MDKIIMIIRIGFHLVLSDVYLISVPVLYCWNLKTAFHNQPFSMRKGKYWWVELEMTLAWKLLNIEFKLWVVRIYVQNLYEWRCNDVLKERYLIRIDNQLTFWRNNNDGRNENDETLIWTLIKRVFKRC